MKYLIRGITAVLVIFVLIVFIVYIGLSFYGKPLIENLFSKILETDVNISSAEFSPLKLNLELSGISILKEDIQFSKGTIHLIPLRLLFQGLDIDKNFSISTDNLAILIRPKKLLRQVWNINADLKNVNLQDILSILPKAESCGVSNGIISGKITGDLSADVCDFYAVLSFYNIDFNESSETENEIFFGITVEDIKEFAENNNGHLDFDLYYTGPLSEIKNPFKYRPGNKTIKFLSSCLINR